MASKKEVSVETIEKAKKALAALPAKEPAKKLLLPALEELKPVIAALLDRGYSRGDVVDKLNEQGIPVKLYHLKSLFSEPRAAAGAVGHEPTPK